MDPLLELKLGPAVCVSCTTQNKCFCIICVLLEDNYLITFNGSLTLIQMCFCLAQNALQCEAETVTYNPLHT